jgi:hypothetical protein
LFHSEYNRRRRAERACLHITIKVKVRLTVRADEDMYNAVGHILGPVQYETVDSQKKRKASKPTTERQVNHWRACGPMNGPDMYKDMREKLASEQAAEKG